MNAGESAPLLQWAVRLGAAHARAAAARELALLLGAEDMLLFVRDPKLQVLVPAPGFPQTVRGGPSWRSFLRGLGTAPIQRGEVELPPGRHVDVLAIAHEGTVAVVVGGAPEPASLEGFVQLLPLLAAMFAAEQRAALAEAEAKEARKAVRRTDALVQSLDTARAEAWRLNAQLTAEHRQRDDFLAMLAHELRNPLAPLVTCLALLRRGGAELLPSQLDIMDRQLRQLSHMVDDLLDVSRVKHGKIELRSQPILLREIVLGAVEATRPMLEARSHALELRLPDRPIALRADPVRLTQVLSNLLHNAAKYTDPGGRIVVSVAQEGAEAVVQVTDNGVGIDAEVLPHIFDLFVQAPVALDRSQGGLGIGLTLVRSLVELHGGRVTAASPGPGRGSTFEVRLPFAGGVQVAPAQDDATSTPGRAARILVVDDNRDLTDSLALLLRFMGHKVDVAHSGLHALQIVSDLDPDLLLLDIGLPDLNGYEAGPRLRRLVGPDALLVAMTGYGSADDRRRSAEAGFDGHLVKPVEPRQLEDIIAALRRRSERPRLTL